MTKPQMFNFKKMFKLLIFQSIIKLSFQTHKNNNLAKTPPMAWMTWQRFRCTIDCQTFPNDCINEQLIKQQADRLAADGWKELGYDTIVIDDCWSEHYRDPKTQKLIPNKQRFPNGILHLSDYVHSLGLKFGIYGDYGTFTCEKYPASMGYETIDAQTFAEWKVDYIKFDGCFSTSAEQRVGYEKFGDALNKTGRDIVYSCSYPAYLGGLPSEVDYKWLGSVCHLWRNYLDIDDSFYSMLKIIEWFGDNMPSLRKYAGPSKWHDPDMLIIGNFGLTEWQAKIQMSMWAMMAAPLIMSTDLRNIDLKSKLVLQNKLAIRVSQDVRGIPGHRIGSRGGFEMWARSLRDNTFSIVIFSVRTDGMAKPFDFKLNYVKDFIEDEINIKSWYKVTDVWKDNPTAIELPSVVDFNDNIVIYLRPHSALMWILEPIKSESDLNNIPYNIRAKVRDTL